jgi:cytochrome c biogenesis protein
MKRIALALASTRLTLAALAALFAVLAVQVTAIELSAGPLITLLALLAVNLAAALVVHPRLRRERALLVFHLALLALLALAAIGRLTFFDGHVEVLEGAAFDPDAVVVDGAGPLHRNRLRAVRFVQGPFEVDYAPGVRRSFTRNRVVAFDGGAPQERLIGDDVPLVAAGYRFYTTHNKGRAVVLTFTAPGRPPLTGALHFPSYPLFDWKQDAAWSAPDRTALKLWLHADDWRERDAAWTLRSTPEGATLVVEATGARHELRVGESLALAGGTLRFDSVRGWMGYRIFFDPTLPWLLGAASIAALALAWFYFARGSRCRAPACAAEAAR